MFDAGPEFLGFFCVLAVMAVLVLVPMLFHMAFFSTVFYALVKQIQQRYRSVKCAHCGTLRSGAQTACDNCGAPFDAVTPPRL